MKQVLFIIIALCTSSSAFCQEIDRQLRHFTRIVASPRVNVVLNHGKQEAIRLVYRNTTEDKVNIEVKGKTLRIYLDDARKVEPMKARDQHGMKESLYEGVSLTAYVTYRELELLEIRGDQELSCADPIASNAFTLRAYGENEIRLASLRTGYFKAKLYGENDLQIKEGRSLEQKYMLYGENNIYTKGFRGGYIVTSIFGEGSLNVYSSENIRIDAFGEPRIRVDGGGDINRRMIIGKANISNN